MKNMLIAEYFTMISRRIVLCLAIVLTNFSYAAQASQDLITIANMLTQQSYSPSEKQDILLLFTGDDIQTNCTPNIPTVQEIIHKVSQLKKSQECIAHPTIKKIAINALKAAINAIDNAILVVYMQSRGTEYQPIVPTTERNKLTNILHSQKQILEEKITQLNEKSISAYLSQPSISYIIAGVVVAMVITGIGLSYYSLLHNTASQIPEIPIVFSGSFDKKRNELYTRMSIILTKFVDPNDQQSTAVYLNEAKSVIQELDPINDAPIIEMLNTFIESQRRTETGMFNKDFLDNARFWKETHDKKSYYTKILTEILNHDPNKAKVFIPDDLDIRKLLSHKNKYNPRV